MRQGNIRKRSGGTAVDFVTDRLLIRRLPLLHITRTPKLFFADLLSRRCRRLVLFILALDALLLVGTAFAGRYEWKVDPSAIAPERGYAFVIHLRKVTGLPAFLMPYDDSEHPTASSLQLYYHGVPLGPAHSSHDDIRNLGNGRYSHWKGWVLFSLRENTDPRSPQADLRVRLKVRPPDILFALVALINIGAGLVVARRLWPDPIVRGGLYAFTGLAGAALERFVRLRNFFISARAFAGGAALTYWLAPTSVRRGGDPFGVTKRR